MPLSDTRLYGPLAGWRRRDGAPSHILVRPQAGTPQPRNIQGADIAPADGFALVVDGQVKTRYDDECAAKKAATELLKRFPQLQVQPYNPATKTRSNI